MPPTNSAELTYLRAKLASWPKFSNLVFATAKLHSEGFSVLFLDLVEGVNVNTCFRILKAVWRRGWDFGRRQNVEVTSAWTSVVVDFEFGVVGASFGVSSPSFEVRVGT